MDYFATFIEGLATFVSPCLLPLLPLYLAYFTGAASGDHALVEQGGDAAGEPAAGVGKGRMLVRVLGFVAGFALVFVALGALAGLLGGLLSRFSTVLSVVCGLVVVLFGLHFAGVLNIPLLDRTLKPDADVRPRTFLASLLFGMAFAFGWTPCVGVFLGSALALAAVEASAAQGALLLLCYSLGLAVPFVACALAIDKLVGVLSALKRHAHTVSRICGALLVVLGLYMALAPLVQQGLEDAPADSADPVSASAQSATAWNNPQLSDVTIVDSDGYDITLGTFCSGKVTVINLWATWCPYCVDEMQDFQKLYDTYGSRIQFVMLDSAENAAEVADAHDYIEANAFTFPVYYDAHAQVRQLFSVAAFPTTIVIDADGQVLSNKPGRIKVDQFAQNLESLV